MITVLRVTQVTGPVTAAEEAEIGRLIAGSTATLGRIFGRYLGLPAERVEIHDGCGVTVLLNDEPTPGADLAVRTRASLFAVWMDLDNTDPAHPVYVLYRGRLEHRSGWPPGRGTVEVTYTAGFAPGAGPLELQQLVLQMVLDSWAARAVAGIDATLKSETIGDYSYTNFTAAEIAGLAAGLGLNWAQLANTWRRRLL